MKKFFFDTDNEIVLRHLAKLPIARSEKKAAEREIQRVNCSDRKEIRVIKALYDLADAINDQRYDVSLAGSERNQKDKSYKDRRKQNSGKCRIEALNELLMANRNYIKRINEPDIFISANITAGNICLRLSNCYLNIFEYEKARKYAQKGREHLWDALQEYKCKNGNNINVYKLLIHFNLAIYYREWAALTRRRNYEFALREIKKVFTDLKKIRVNNNLNNLECNDRQLALIYIDAMINKGRIYRLDYSLEEAHVYLAAVVSDLQNVKIQHIGQNYFKLKNIKINLDERGGIRKEEEEAERKKLKDLLESLKSSDWIDYLLSALIQFSIVLIKQRDYVKAQLLLSNICESAETNHDAKNNIGICYRKQKNLTLAIKEFLSVVKNEQNTNEKLAVFFSEEVSRIKKENSEYPLIRSENLGGYSALVNRFAYINLLKCVLEQSKIDSSYQDVFANASYIIDNHLKYNPCDFEVKFLKCRYMIQENKQDDAIELLKSMIEMKELSYVRHGTLGLKVRYLLSKCYLKTGRFNEAEKLLLSIRAELQKDGSECEENKRDPLVENNIGWCLLRQGRYEDALECYTKLVRYIYVICCKKEGNIKPLDIPIIEQLKKIFGKEISEFFDYKDNSSKLSDKKREKIEIWRNSSRLNVPCLNSIGECYLRMGFEDDEKLQIAKKIFDFIIQIEQDNGIASLYRGYCEIDWKEQAKYFEKAFRLAPHEIEVRSAYLIHMVEIFIQAKNNEKKDKKKSINVSKQCLKEISDFIEYIPYTYSINMCLALLNLKIKENERFMDIVDYKNRDQQKQRVEFYKNFSRIELFNELGTRAFYKLKNKHGFQHLKAEERGQIMTHLIYLYEPIIKIRKKCHFGYEHWKDLVSQVKVSEESGDNKTRRNRSGLVHYTKLDTLKALLDQNGTHHLRISNSGYMNDSSEGEIFFEEMRNAIKSKKKHSIKIENLIQCYFHELQGNPDKVLPRGGNVYITSLSTQSDSFPMWDIYAGKEQGCNIEFNEGYFDLKGSSSGVLKEDVGKLGLDFGISTYSDDDYPLYAIQYVYRDHYVSEDGKPNSPKICSRKPKMEFDFLEERLGEIAERWDKLEQLLIKISKEYAQIDIELKTVKEAVDEIRAFVADRINEIRYLFKDRDYQFEGEVRLVRVVDADDTDAHTDSREIPRAFTEVDKEIKDIVVTLASKLSDEQVNEITTWLKHTGRVKDVRIATRNRLRQSVIRAHKK